MQVGSKQDGGKHEEPPRSIHETNGDLCAAAYLRRAGLALAQGHVRDCWAICTGWPGLLVHLATAR